MVRWPVTGIWTVKSSWNAGGSLNQVTGKSNKGQGAWNKWQVVSDKVASAIELSTLK
jgi:hypothetical protein